MTQANTDVPVLEAQGVSKRFDAVVALRDASLVLNRGEVVALMGANGAGKSTFVKILTGVLSSDTGHVRLRGADAKVRSPAQARRSGLVPVYQESALIPDLNVADNLRLGNTPVDAFRHWVDALGISDLRLDDMVRRMPLATLRIMDLARALAAEPDVLLLDEITAALPTDLVTRVLSVARAQADAGRSIIYISHRFAEIAELCDSATVLRDGATVGSVKIEPGIEGHIVEMMLGAQPAHTTTKISTLEPAVQGTPRLAIRNLAAGNRMTDVSFDLRKGEVLGVVALEGQGQDELFDVLAGNRKAIRGSVAIDGQLVSFRHPAEAISSGVTLVPGDREKALLMSRSVRENIALPLVAPIADWGRIPLRDEAARVTAAIERLQIDTRTQGEVRRLSGGNQQKVTIARWIAKGVETLLLFDPTRGIDIRTKRQIYALVHDLASQGAAVLFYTSELNEVPLACDRVAVIFNGRVVDVIDAADADEPTLMRAAYGLTEKKATA